jgi:hypothetical protein
MQGSYIGMPDLLVEGSSVPAKHFAYESFVLTLERNGHDICSQFLLHCSNQTSHRIRTTIMVILSCRAALSACVCRL